VGSSYDLVYTVYGSGDVVVEAAFEPGETALPELPRFGMRARLRAGFENLEWYGPGAVPTAASAPPDINTGPDNTPSEICMFFVCDFFIFCSQKADVLSAAGSRSHRLLIVFGKK